jgi:hypothetical protein
MEETYQREPESTGIGGAIVLTVLVGTMMVGAVNYTVKRHDLDSTVRAAQQSEQADQDRAVAATRAVAAIGGDLVQNHLFVLQDMLASRLKLDGLVEADILDSDAMVIASMHPERIGQNDRVQPAAEANTGRESIQREQDAMGQPLLAVRMPLTAQQETLGWVKLVFTARPAPITAPSGAKRLREVATLVGPIIGVLAVGLGWIRRSAQSNVHHKPDVLVSTPQQAANASRLDASDPARRKAPLQKVG